MTDFSWTEHVEVESPGCWVWVGRGYPPAREVWRDLMGVDLPPSKVLQRKCRRKECLNPDHHLVQNRAAMDRISHFRRWGGRLPEWDGKGCHHVYYRNEGCAQCG